VAQRLVALFGWRQAYSIFGLAILLVPLPVVAAFLKEKPESMGLLPDGAAEPHIVTQIRADEDLPHVLERATERGFPGGELTSRSAMLPCDFLREVPSGCRAYVMKHVIHDWDDEHARTILVNCRRAVPADGALLLVEWALPEANLPSTGKILDVVMLLLTGGRERTIEECGELMGSAGFRLNRVVPTSTD
jgi:hypothetical protein